MLRAIVFFSGLLAFYNSPLAADVIIDSFDHAQGPVVDVAGGGVNSLTVFAPPTGELWTRRTISVLASGAGLFSGDPSAVAAGGLFGINNDSAETSVVELSWALPAISTFAGATSGLFVLDLMNNNPSNLVPSTVTLSYGASTTGPFRLPAIPPGIPAFAISLSGTELSELTSGTNVKLTFRGGDGYDIVLRSVSIVSNVPEPSEWMLLMAGLATVSAITRRRKAATS
jgi:hypothetical protein